MYMRTEIYCVRSNNEEIEYLNLSFKKLIHALDEKSSIRVLLKTQIDSNPRKIKKEFLNCLENDNPLEFYIYANALDTQDSSSFRRLFAPLVKVFEKTLAEEAHVLIDRKAKQSLDVVVTPILIEGESYPAYCLSFKGKKLLVLPRIKFVQGDYTDYMVNTVNEAKKIFALQNQNHSQGYIISSSETAKESESAVLTPPAQVESTQANNSCEEISASIEAEKQKNTSEDEVSDELPHEEVLTSQGENLGTDLEEVDGAILETESQVGTDENFSETDETEKSADTQDESSKGESESTNAESENTEGDQAESPADSTQKKKSAKALFWSFIPHKGDSKSNIILKIIILIAVSAFLVGGILLLNFYVIGPAINNHDMLEIQNIFYSSYDEAVTIVDSDGNSIVVEANSKNWKGLKKVNKEIVGWIKIDKTVIDYPVLEHKGDSMENQYYLYRNYKGNYSDFGSIFVDYRCTKSVKSKNVILHGHNMGSDSSMFATLTKYPGNLKYYKAAPIIHFDTPEAEGDYAIFSVMRINVDNKNEAIFNYLLGEFESSAQFMNFIYNQKELSYLNVDLPINENDTLLTLSTCSYEDDNMRTVVVARKLREGEDITKYVKSAKTKSPAYAVYSTFSRELASGNIKWYDGDGKLEGDEDLEYMKKGDMYEVKYVDSNGKTISKQYVLKGKDAKPPENYTPRKAAANGYYYVFKSWDSNGKNIQKDTVIKPVFTKKKMPTVQSTTRPTAAEEVWEDEPLVTQAPEPPETTVAEVTTVAEATTTAEATTLAEAAATINAATS